MERLAKRLVERRVERLVERLATRVERLRELRLVTFLAIIYTYIQYFFYAEHDTHGVSGFKVN